jgi:3-oxoadipate enol-lactonase
MTQPILRCVVEPVRSGAPDAQLIVLGPSLGTTTALWDGVVGSLAERHRVLRFDLPGHGLSPAATAPFSVAELAASVVTAVDSVGGGSFHYAGISLGGAIGLELALGFPDRLRTLAVICSGAKIGASEGWRERAAQIRASGTPGFLERDPSAGSGALEKLMDVDDESYALCCDALAEFDVADAVGGIRLPTVCVSGEYDLPTPTALLKELADAIPGARQVTISNAAHLPAYEQPDTVAALLLAHIGGRAATRVPSWEPAPRTRPMPRVWEYVAPSSVTPTSTGRPRRSRRRRPTSRISSPATRGARSGPGRDSTGVPAASSPSRRW